MQAWLIVWISDNGTDVSVLQVPFLAGQGIGTRFDWNYTTTNQVRQELPFPI